MLDISNRIRKLWKTGDPHCKDTVPRPPVCFICWTLSATAEIAEIERRKNDKNVKGK